MEAGAKQSRLNESLAIDRRVIHTQLRSSVKQRRKLRIAHLLCVAMGNYKPLQCSYALSGERNLAGRCLAKAWRRLVLSTLLLGVVLGGSEKGQIHNETVQDGSGSGFV